MSKMDGREMTLLLAVVVLLVLPAPASPHLCDVTSGQAIIILDITESLGTQVDQLTSPSEVPVEGDPQTEVQLEVTEPGKEYFILNGRRLQLVKPLDRDQQLSTLRFQVSCTIRSSGEVRTIPVIVRITDINDNAPIFSGLPYAITVPELTPVGTTIFRKVHADDLDAGVNGQVDYSIIRSNSNPESDGYGYFSITLPHQGLVTVNRSLDYERSSVYYVTIMAMDRAQSAESRLSSTTTLTVTVADSDDQDPAFEYAGCARVGSICANPEYSASVTSGEVSGVLSVKPERIHAADLDSLATPIRYSFMSGRPGTYDRFFAINPQTGAVTHIAAVDRAVTRKFEIVVKAEEESEAKRFATAKLVINVQGVDSSPPVVTASSYTGNVNENAAPGTPVYDDHPEPRPIVLTVIDPDLTAADDLPKYTWEMTTTAFRVGSGGQLVVAENNLDRDPPNPGLYTFQIVAREAWEGGAASAPITLTVVLNDVNDNQPRLPVYPPVSVQAGSAHRIIAQISAKDNDAGENAEIKYSIYHVSNSGHDKFFINATTGELALVGEVNAGNQYSITLRATDRGGLYSQSILEVMVNRGPNTGGPVFSLPRYSASVSEGAAPNSAILTLKALDPEGDPARFSIISGNELNHFDIGEASGTMRLISQLDRESLDSYNMVIKAEDPEGVFNTATVSISVGDINDKNPEFIGLPYSFRVDEGQQDAVVGSVKAEDEDLGVNGEVFYSVPENSPFNIASNTGEIRTKQALDYEKQQVHLLVVTAKDGAADPRLSTATVTVLVSDVGDEPPVFSQQVYEATVPENVADSLLTTVVATDPDTKPVITYVMVNGDSKLFSVEPETGRITTVRGLDYEASPRHTIIVGTLENTDGGPQSTCSVLVTVKDANDNPPVFTMPLRPITIPEASPPGTLVATIMASDADGTKPNNVVEYELVGYNSAPDYFTIENDTGIITIKADLQAEQDSDFELEIVARDGGEPQLSTTSTASISIERARVEPPPVEAWATFTDTQFSVEVLEDAQVATLVKRLTVLNRPEDGEALRCTIIDGNTEETFGIEVTPENHCGLTLQAPLDFESAQHYSLTVAMEAPTAPPDTENRIAKVEISVADVNDNEPEFIFKAPYNDNTHGSYFAFVAEDSQISTSVLQLTAKDKDSGEFGHIQYGLVPESNRGGYFSIGPTSGLLRTEREMSSVPRELLPFNLTVVARDNPNHAAGESIPGGDVSHSTAVPVIVNLVQESHRLVLVVEASPDRVKDSRDDLVAVLQEYSKQIIGIEKIESRRFVGNTSVQTDTNATDVWFHIVDANSGKVLERQHPVVKKFATGEPDRKTLLFYVTAALEGVPATDIRSPILMLQPVSEAPIPPVRKAVTFEGFQLALIVLAGIIVIMGVTGICYICVQWKRYVRHRNEADKAVVVVAPPYERVGSVIEPVTKEYEVQVLHMSVPMDDESVQELTLDSRPSHHFSMDNVSYITKQQLSDDGSTASSREVDDVMDGDQSISGMMHHHQHDKTVALDWDTPPGQRHLQHIAAMAAATTPSGRNPAYEHFADDEDGGEGPLSVSTTNENVLFGRRGLTDPSPVQTTTEL
ncbi:cadherin-99C isoform X1 [Procambarus clarkii]|uniref:cadherin-99C isoform X1 n=2 Tax=Procambarus clarkii TaxID=6728 RepID=UPI003743C118